jgi:hypothetical protein
MENIGYIENVFISFRTGSVMKIWNVVGEIVLMKANYPAKIGLRAVFFAIIIVVTCTYSSAYSQSQQITLLVQQTPNNAGEVTPIEGAYKYEQDAEVTLTATPREGYEFIHWLGDVSDQESTSTTVHLNKPKIVIAVFEPVGEVLDTTSHISSGGGGGGLISNRVAIGNSVSISGGGGSPSEPAVYAPSSEPPAVPEPATGLFLALGSFFAFTKRPRKKIVTPRN